MQTIVFHYKNDDDSHLMAMGWLVENERILWGNDLNITKDKYDFPIIGYILMDGKVRYKSIIHDIYSNIDKNLQIKYKPLSWHDPEKPYTTHFMLTNFHPCGPFEINTFIKNNGEPLKKGFRGYAQVIEKGKEPKLNIDQIKEIIKAKFVNNYTFNSLKDISSHNIIDIKDDGFRIIYNTDKSRDKLINYNDWYAVYSKLYELGYLNNQYMENHFQDKDLLPDWKHWHAPGSAILAELPLIDNNIINNNGELKIRER